MLFWQKLDDNVVRLGKFENINAPFRQLS
ncbi:hypothetical protein AGR8A_Lc10522 [Agrobacterium fabrum str. J-07]|nr:hypothetical protein AGR8A_Lc10522 [Agrobacterium fabrum str. J-07]